MLTSIFQSLTSGLGGMLSSLITTFMEALNINLGEYLEIFPYLGTVYSILQGIAIGLVAIIAGRHLAMFGLGAVDSGNLQDRPINILIRSFIAAAAIYFGGYVLQFVVELGTIPFNIFMESEAKVGDISDILLDGAGLFISRVKDEKVVSDIVIALLSFFFVLMISWNVFKLAIEVCERYVMVGVLVFTSPIVYPTISTKETSQIFKRWCGMFVSSLIMMSASVLFLKLVVNGLSNSLNAKEAPEFLIRLLIIVATCKIAQRVDTYLGQLGLTTAITGGSLLDDMLGMVSAMRRIGSTARGAILGAGAVASRTVLGRAAATGAEAFRSGKTVGQSFAAAGRAADENFHRDTALGRAQAEAKKAREHNKNAAPGQKKQSVAGAAAKGAAVGTARNIGQFVAPNTMAKHDAGKANQVKVSKEEAASSAKLNSDAAKNEMSSKNVGSNPVPPSVKDKIDSGKAFTKEEQKNNLQEFGVQDDGHVLTANDISGDSAEPSLSKAAQAAGVEMDIDDKGKTSLTGSSMAVGAALNAMESEVAGTPANVGQDRLSDESLGDKAIRQQFQQADRAEFMSSQMSTALNTVEKSSPETLGKMLNGKNALHGSVDSADAAKILTTPVTKRANESQNEYNNRYLKEMNAKARAFDELKQSGNSAAAYTAASRYFEGAYGGAGEDGNTLLSYKRVDHGSHTDEHGNRFNDGSSHMLKYESSDGNVRQMEAVTPARYTSLSKEDQSAYHEWTAPDRSKYYIRDVDPNGGSGSGPDNNPPQGSPSQPRSEGRRPAPNVQPTYTSSDSNRSAATRSEPAYTEPSPHQANSAPVERQEAPSVRPTYTQPETQSAQTPPRAETTRVEASPSQASYTPVERKEAPSVQPTYVRADSQPGPVQSNPEPARVEAAPRQVSSTPVETKTEHTVIHQETPQRSESTPTTEVRTERTVVRVEAAPRPTEVRESNHETRGEAPSQPTRPATNNHVPPAKKKKKK